MEDLSASVFQSGRNSAYRRTPALTRPSPRRRVRPCPLWTWLLGRSSDLQATYLLQLPSSLLNQCLCRSVRSCLPLRGSSGFSPNSLLGSDLAIRHREVLLVYRPQAGKLRRPRDGDHVAAVLKHFRVECRQSSIAPIEDTTVPSQRGGTCSYSATHP